MSNEHTVKVNTFILGAPKCGTTSIATWLSMHPEVCFSKEKEPHYFYTPYHFQIDKSQYDALFLGVNDNHKVIAEASVWYLFSQTAAPSIVKYNAAAKFIVCVRNPVDMAVSLHAQVLSNKNAAYENTLSFSKAWSYSDERFSGDRAGVRGPNFDTRMLAYKQACYLGSQLQALFNQVPRQNVHVLVMDDLKANARAEWLKLQNFLDLDDDGRENFAVINAAAAPKSFRLHKLLNKVGWLKQALGINKSFNLLAGVHKQNMVQKSYEKPSPELFQEMQLAFEQEIQLLEQLLQRDFSDWRKVKE